MSAEPVDLRRRITLRPDMPVESCETYPLREQSLKILSVVFASETKTQPRFARVGPPSRWPRSLEFGLKGRNTLRVCSILSPLLGTREIGRNKKTPGT